MSRPRVHMFFSRLDFEYDQVRGEILRKEPKLSLEQSYAYIRKVQSEKQAMGSGVSTESTVLAIGRRENAYPAFTSQPSHCTTVKTNPHANKKCNACGELGHNKERCYEVIGYPDWWDFTKKTRKNISKANIATVRNEHEGSDSANVAQSEQLDSTDSWLWC
ncbi:CCHC-type domain-containing protein [Heracleum sosnowskyi]|uniref:CCHC-type domain-containing protein n=1 Tax=Heracleum sosnowskyi TaxID=360622 RepID=A0AAD8H0W5_9APIA|nr:CCHC-type domain-containing protein [Heracleum sosnowskyi]